MQLGLKRTIFGVACIIAACTILLGYAVFPAHADDYTDQLVAPAQTARVWVDVESSDSVSDGVDGTLGSTNLDFKDSPVGVTAVVSSDPGSKDLALKAKKDVDVLVAVTFVDKNDVVLAQTSGKAHLTKSAQNVTVPPVKKNDNEKNDNASDNNSGASTNAVLGLTGVNIAAIAGLLVVAAICGTGIVVLRSRHATHAIPRQGE
ncbi:hypothetical protein [Bifidobacterium subtile]|jgi:hypothetical protein|uniref:Uncharacterized protein n=1 Tax=Bifidobacterium subtile TaxID=77635 RepID=A0A087DTR1_9BIFI|nr:hypothetical protein [Bifidobacterium subtile]KFI98911.1 hypothetical protein BISU_2112 [Bifidobacterium subtile]QOL36401.1 hypothetical protein BS3272_11335 [Bifidobacterium subtile]